MVDDILLKEMQGMCFVFQEDDPGLVYKKRNCSGHLDFSLPTAVRRGFVWVVCLAACHPHKTSVLLMLVGKRRSELVKALMPVE